MADNNRLVISSYGLSSTGKGQNLDNMYLNGRYINVPTETSSKIQKQDTVSFQVYGVSDSEIGIGEDRSIGTDTGSIVMDMLMDTQNRLNNQRIEKEPIWDAITEANRATKEIREKTGADILGTSFAALYLHGNRGLAVHLGDSRIYVIRGGRTLQITDDHLESSDMFRLGILTQAQAEVHKSASRLTAYVGMDNVYDCRDEAFSKFFVYYPGDIFILCTDGITDAILNDKMEKITRLLKDATPDQIAATLMDTASEHNDADRTIIVLRIEAVGAEVAPRAVSMHPAPQESAFNEQQPINPAVPVQHSLNQPLPQDAQQPQYQEPQNVQQPAAQPMPNVPQQNFTQDPQQGYVPQNQPDYVPQDPQNQQPAAQDPNEDYPDRSGASRGSNFMDTVRNYLDGLLAEPKKLAMVIGIAAVVLILLIVLIAAASSSKKKKQDPNSLATKTESSIDSSAVSSSLTGESSDTSVVAVYETSSAATSTEESSSEEESETTYEVEDGDTLYQIVLDHYDTADMDYIEALAEYNGFSVDDDLYVGQTLKMPTSSDLAKLAGDTEEESEEEESDEDSESSEE